VSRTPYRGRTPEPRANAPTGTPGTPGIPDAAASSVPVNVVKPAGDNADTCPVAGAAQLEGTDKGPIEFARPAVQLNLCVGPSTVLGRDYFLAGFADLSQVGWMVTLAR
jgi:hypothetical protein